VDWKWCDWKLSRSIWSKILIRTDDIGWCHDLILGDFGEEQIICDAVLTNLSSMWIEKYVRWIFHHQFEVIMDYNRR
jgi:hypothetical protein